MPRPVSVALVVSWVMLIGGLVCDDAAAARRKGPALPKGITVPADVALPSETVVAIYVPARFRSKRTPANESANAFESGGMLTSQIGTAVQPFFANATLTAAGEDRPYGLLITLHPDFDVQGNSVTTTFHYRVFGTGNEPLASGKQVAVTSHANLFEALRRGWLRTSQQVFADVVTQLKPDAAKFPATANVKQRANELLANRELAVSSGTGFYVNAAGQVVTAAHVIEECLVVDVKRDSTAVPGLVVASSALLDLAVLDTATPAERFLPLRKGHDMLLGEAATNVGYPLQKLLAATPNLTRGNVSSRGALEGSVGQFQFSAPVQPGSSGGPVVSDGGELLGVTVGTLNAAALIKSGALPQNVNFALDAKYVAMFLRKHGVAYTEVDANPKGDPRTANDAALSTVVAIKCYQ